MLLDERRIVFFVLSPLSSLARAMSDSGRFRAIPGDSGGAARRGRSPLKMTAIDGTPEEPGLKSTG
ncbi:MAG: hypothetical protein LBI87_03890 [Candidatus Accumulibacter sp.]|jgi:hypothetical protein|nr:hypothetical protein [Accumulibacter sp.]